MIISEKLCSLNGGVDRLAVSVVWTVDPENDFEILDVWFGRTIIHSKHQVIFTISFAVSIVISIFKVVDVRLTLEYPVFFHAECFYSSVC